MVKYFLWVTFEIISWDRLKVLQVLHLLSLQREIVKPVVDASPRATMNDVPPSSRFTITPALPWRERSTRLGGSALGEVTCSAGCAEQACDRVLGMTKV